MAFFIADIWHYPVYQEAMLKKVIEILATLAKVFLRWRRKSAAQEAQAEFDRIESDPVSEFERMFDRTDADEAAEARTGHQQQH